MSDVSGDLARQILSSAPTIMYAFELANRRTLFVNRSLSAYLGHLPRQGSVFDEWREYLHPEDRD